MEHERDDEFVDKSSEVGKLIVKVNQLEKRPTLDNSLGEILDSFLRALIHSEDFLINGIFKINFAEAAILLQSSALIYSKKVDLLWDSINECQKRLVSYKTDDNEEEIKRIEERERKYKRRRKQIEPTHNKDTDVIKLKSFHVDWEDVDNFQHLNFEKDSKLYSGWYKKMVMKWDLQPTSKCNRSLADKQIQFRSPENAIFDRDHDNEFVVYTSKMESVIGLEEVLFPEKPRFNDFSFQLYTELHLIPKFLRENRFCYEDLEKHSIDLEKYIESYKDLNFQRNKRYDDNYDKTIDRQTPQKLRRISISSTIMSRVDMSDLDNIYVKKCQVNLLRLSVDDLSRISRLSVDEVKKFSCYYEGEDSKLENFQEHFCTENKVDIDTLDSSPQNTGGKDVDINISSLGELTQSLECNDNTDTNQADTSTFEDATHSSDHQAITDKTMISQVRRSVRLNETKEIVEITKHTETKQIKRIEEILNDDGIPKKRIKLSKAAMKRLATGVTVDLDKFNSFFAIHYQPEEGEGSVEIPEFTFEDPIDSSSTIDLGEKRPASPLSDHPILCTQDSGYESNFQENLCHNDTTIDDIVSPLLEIDDQVPEEPLRQESSPTEPCVGDEEKPLHQRVYEWKEHMSEKFKEMKSADFDIHEYGSNIMDSFEQGPSQKFGNIVRGKSSAEVTRFFISALQLANTYNVEIQGAQNGKLSNDTFELKLLTKERYYDRLKDYVAPSEQDYHKRLSCAQKMHKKRSFPSTSGNSCSLKRNKYQ